MRFHHRRTAAAWRCEFRKPNAGHDESPEMIKMITRNLCSNEQAPHLQRFDEIRVKRRTGEPAIELSRKG